MRKSVFLIVSLLLLSVGCVSEGIEPDPPPIDLTSQSRDLAAASEPFGFTLFASLAQANQDENLILSPLSVSTALGMTLLGARGETAEGMRQALRLPDLPREDLGQAYLALLASLPLADERVQLEIANSIWHRDDARVLDSFVADIGLFFRGVVTALDFDAPSAVETINRWVEEKTHGKIKSIVDSDRLDPQLLMILINAIYFKADWTYQFAESNTQPAAFTAADGTELTVPTMSLRAELPYFETEEAQVLRLPYGNGNFSMVLILPAPGLTAAALASRLDADRWHNLQSSLVRKTGNLWLPRFELSYKTELNDVLIALGMARAFEPAADFSGIFGSTGSSISQVIHKTYLKVDEKGTEAAAVTGVFVDSGVCDGCASSEFEMRVNRPFLLLIQSNEPKSLLFAGLINDPR